MGKAEILEAISGMSVLELSELITEMEEKFGVSAAAAAVAVAAPGGAAGGVAFWGATGCEPWAPPTRQAAPRASRRAACGSPFTGAPPPAGLCRQPSGSLIEKRL